MFEKLSPASHWAWLAIMILSRSLQDTLYCLFCKWKDGPLRFVSVCVGGCFGFVSHSACLCFMVYVCVGREAREGQKYCV